MNSKKSFILHLDSLDVYDELSDEEIGKLNRAFRDYHLGKEIDLPKILKVVFISFKNQFDRDNGKYEEIVNRNKINGLKGGRPKKKTQKTQMVSEKPRETQNNPEKPKKPDNDSDSVNDSENVNENKNETSVSEIEKTVFDKTFEDFRKMRKTIKKPMTEKAEKLILSKLNDLAGDNDSVKINILERSIINCWQDVFPLNPNQTSKTPIDKEEIERKKQQENLNKLYGNSEVANV